MSTVAKHKCPNCGNADEAKMEDNGLKSTHWNYTLLCVARVDQKDWAFNHTSPDPDQIDADGKVACGMQWNPNAK